MQESQTPGRAGDSESAETVASRTLFNEFDPRTAAVLVDLAIETRFEAGKVIFHERDPAGQFYCVAQGSVGLEQPSLTRTVRIQTLHAGEFFGWSAFLGSGTRHFQARALTRVVAVAFDGSLLRKACERDTQFGYVLTTRLLMLVTERLDATRAQVAGLDSGTRLERPAGEI